MSKLRTNIFSIATISNYFWSSVACKNQRLKVDYFILLLFLVPKLKSVAQNEWKKHPYIFFSTFGSKLNEFELKHFYVKNQNNQLLLLRTHQRHN